MTLVTIDGHIGAGASELGRRVARMFDLDYIDRLVLPGSETGAETDTAEQPQRRSHERFWAFVEKAIRGIALGNAAGDPYYAAPEIMLMPLTWDTSPGAPMARNKAETEGQSVRHTIESLIVKGGAVLVHRAGAVATRGHSQVLRVGLFASWEDRVKRIMRLEGVVRSQDAERLIRQREEAQVEYFSAVHSAHPEDESIYDVAINTSRDQINLAALKVSRALKSGLLIPAPSPR